MSGRIRAGVNLDTRAGAALAFSVGLHLLALLLWRQVPHPPQPPVPLVSRVVTILLRAPAPALRQTPAVSNDAPPAQPRQPGAARRPSAVPADAPTLAPASPPTHMQPADALAAPPAPAQPANAGTPAPTALPSATDNTGTPSAPQGGAPAGGFSVGLAKRQAGRIDRALRGGKPGVPLEADTPWARFQRNVEAAHNDRSMSVQEDMATTPDGVIIYRYRQGNQVRCRRSGSVGLGIPGAAGINDAGWISCPNGASWQPVD